MIIGDKGYCFEHQKEQLSKENLYLIDHHRKNMSLNTFDEKFSFKNVLLSKRPSKSSNSCSALSFLTYALYHPPLPLFISPFSTSTCLINFGISVILF